MTITSVVNQLSQRITRGDTAGTSDQLLYAPIQVLRVGLAADTNDYVLGADYNISGNTVDWNPAGAEPNPGQVYYITYKYNPTQFLKDFDTVSSELRTDYNTLLPNMDVSKSAARDLFVNVPSRQLTDLYSVARHIYLIQSLQNISEITNAELDAIGVNYSIVRLPATKAGIASLRLFMNTARAYPVNIPVGTRVATMPSLTNNQQITFVTTTAGTINAGQTSVLVTAEADTAGLQGNVSSGTVIVLIDSLDVDGVSNSSSATGGSDEEGNEDYAKRLINAFKARNVASVTGIRELTLAQANVIDCYVADVGDPIMVRDGGLGGKVDIYIQAETGFSGLISSESYTYAGNYTLLLQPAIAIVSVYNVTTLTDITASSTLVKDTNVNYKESTRAADVVNISSGAAAGNVIQVTYTYNKLFNDIQNLLNSDAYHVAGIDDLVRGATQTFIDVSGSIKIASGYIFADVQGSISTQLSNYIEAKEIGSQIVYGDIINIIHDTPGVADLLPMSRLCRSTENSVSTIQLYGNEFPRAGTITITQIP